MKYRAKPEVFEAVQYTGTRESALEVQDFMGVEFIDTDKQEFVCLLTSNGWMFARAGDWIIRGINGEFYPCKPDIFEKTYEPVEEE